MYDKARNSQPLFNQENRLFPQIEILYKCFNNFNLTGGWITWPCLQKKI